MTDVVRAELIKLRSIRMPWWLLGAAIAMALLIVLVTVPTRTGTQQPLAIADEDLLARVLGVAASGGVVVVLVLGILAFTQEGRFGTVTATYLATPARGRVLAAKVLAMVVAGAVFAGAMLTVAAAAATVLIDVRGGSPVWNGEVAGVLAAAVAVMILHAALGVAVGALVQNQIAAVVGALVWLLVVEQLLIQLLTEIGRWTLGGTTAAFLQAGRTATTTGDLLPVWPAAVVLCAYVAIVGALASATTLRRDIG